MINFSIVLVSVVISCLYLVDLKKHKLNIRTMVPIAMLTALSYILHMIQFIKYPQGGGITLLSMMPIMLLSLLYGRVAGVTGGLILGLFKLLNGGFIIHPLQLLLDYIFSNMAVGLAGVFGNDKKIKIIWGCLLASSLSVFISIISGVVFFSQYAPPGMNVWVYSFIYNFTSAGVEGILTIIVISTLPIKRFI